MEQTSLKKNAESKLDSYTLSKLKTKQNKNTAKQVGEMQYHHKPQPWHGELQSGGNSNLELLLEELRV